MKPTTTRSSKLLSCLVLIAATVLVACSGQDGADAEKSQTTDAPKASLEACKSSTLPLSEIENTSLSPLVTDRGDDVFLENGRYRSGGNWGGAGEPGTYRICGQNLCTKIENRSEICRPLSRQSSGRYLDSSGRELIFKPLAAERLAP